MKRSAKITKPLTRREVASQLAGQFKSPFRGEIFEFFRDVKMERGFANQGQPFDIETACYLKEPLHLLRTMPFGMFVAMAAVQMLKTNGMIEQPAGYFLANDPGDMTIFLTGDESAFDQAKARLMPYLKSQKQIREIIENVTSASSSGRHDITTDEFYLPGMVLRVWPLNLTSTQRNTLRYVFVSDAFLSGRTGMLSQAIKRKTQHDSIKVRDYKVVIESQGGEVGDDFDAVWCSTDQRRLNVTCPFCATMEEFSWHRKRGEDFVPMPTKDIPSLDWQAWIAHHRPILLAEDRCHAGMKRGDPAVKRTDGSYDADEVKRQTYYECYHCGGTWQDITRIRQQIDSSSHYVPTNKEAPAENIGFWWPAWAGQRLSWGNIMLDYLESKAAASQGNLERIKQWHQKVEGRPWSQEILLPETKLTVGSYDPNQIMPDELCRIMSIDCQQDQDHYDKTGASIPGWFWAEAAVVDKFGNARQLYRAHCKSWEEWIGVQKKWKIPNDYVVIDIGKWPQQIMLRAAAEREEIHVQSPLPWLQNRTKTWLLLAGDDARNFGKHRDQKYRPWSPPQSIHCPVVDADGKRKAVTLTKVRWSNVAFKLQLDAIRSAAPGMPKYEILAREHLDAHTQEIERGVYTYEMQMQGEYYEAVKGKDAYHPVAGSRPSHYRDTRMQIMVKMAMLGLLGHQVEDAQEKIK